MAIRNSGRAFHQRAGDAATGQRIEGKAGALMKSYAGFLAYRLKMQPLDFQVQEIAELPLKSESAGRFSVYELEKTGWNTADVISRIAKESCEKQN